MQFSDQKKRASAIASLWINMIMRMEGGKSFIMNREKKVDNWWWVDSEWCSLSELMVTHPAGYPIFPSLCVRIKSISFRLLIVMRSHDPHLQNWWQQTQFLKSAGGTILKAGVKKKLFRRSGCPFISQFNSHQAALRNSKMSWRLHHLVFI